MGNFSTNSFPSNRWTDSDVLSDLDQGIQSIDAAIRHAFGFSTNTLTAPFDIADDGSIVVQTSIAIGTSNAMIDVVDSIPASAGANEDQKLAHVEAIREYVVNVAVEEGDLDSRYYTETEVDALLALYLPLAGGTMTGDLIVTGSDIVLDYERTLIVEDGGGTGRNLLSIADVGGTDYVSVGDAVVDVVLRGKQTRPEYDDNAGGFEDLALYSDLDNYLPLAAGSDNQLTGDLYITSATNPTLYIRENGDDSNYAYIRDDGILYIRHQDEGVSVIQVDPIASDLASSADIMFFRTTNTSGDSTFTIYPGDGTTNPSHTLTGGADVDFCIDGGTLTVGGVTNYAALSDVGLYLNGTATMWDDLRVSALAVKVPASGNPTFAKFKDNGAASQGVFLYWFDPTSEQEVYFAAQMPHHWKEGSDIEAHVHWVSADTAPGSGTDVCWGLEYTWANIDGTFGNTTIIYGDEQSNGSGETITVDKHYLTEIGTITGSGKTLSSMLVCRLFRDAGGVGGTDDYDDDAGLMEIDFHYEIDSLGSKEEYTKGP